MSKKTKIALCMIVKATDGEADFLSKALNQIADHVDGLFITITGKNERVERVAKMYKANVSYFEWINDFSAARNFNFNQVPKEYTHIMWQDADDLIRGAEDIRKVVEKNPDVDGFLMPYLYWFDEHKNPTIVHLKTQIVKNDGCVEWYGELHEDFKRNREMVTKLVEGVDRIHTTTIERVEQAAQRNLEVSLSQAQKHPHDPRVYWNLGNSYYAVKDAKNALENFDKFLGMSRSDDEKYIALIRQSEVYMVAKDYQMALNAIKMAIGTKPEYPDAYHTKGNILFEMKDYFAAKDCYKMGLEKKPPVHQIIAYNPRDYDYTPLKNLARAYFNINLPNAAVECLKKALEIVPGDKETKNLIDLIQAEADEMEEAMKAVEQLSEIAKNKELDGDDNAATLLKLKEVMDGLSDKVKAHPLICSIRNRNFVKTTSSGRDLVFYCGPTGEDWNPQTAKEKGIGGSEEAIINLSTALAKRGWNVSVYNSSGFKEQMFDGVKWFPYWMWNYNDLQDVTVIWRSPKAADWPINTKKLYIDVHDAIGHGEFNEARLEKIDKIFVKSQAHRDLYPNVPDEKFVIVPNGVDLSLFETPSPTNKAVERDPYLIINLSSPDRSLSATMEIFEEAYSRVSKDIKKKMKLAWYYGWQVFDSIRISAQEKEWSEGVKKRFENLKEKGIAIGGVRINHADVAELNLAAGALLYPSEFYEIDWIGGSKAQIGGAVVITAGFAAQGEKTKYGIKIPSKKTIDNWADIPGCDYSITDPAQKEMFVNALVDYLENVEKFEKTRSEMKMWAREKYNLEAVADVWHEELKS